MKKQFFSLIFLFSVISISAQQIRVTTTTYYGAICNQIYESPYGTSNWTVSPYSPAPGSITSLAVTANKAYVSIGSTIYEAPFGTSNWTISTYSPAPGSITSLAVTAIQAYVSIGSTIYEAPFGTSNWTISTYSPAPGSITSLAVTANKAYVSIGSTVYEAAYGTSNWVLSACSPIPDCSVGIIGKSNDNNLLIFPNPTTDIINISNPQIGNFRNTILIIYDLQGQLIRKYSISQEKTHIDLKDLLNGVYIMKLAYEDKVEVIRIIKE